MIPKNSEWLDPGKNLANFLAETSSSRDSEMITLLVDMHRDGALAFRGDTRNGFPICLWYPVNPDVYADRIFPMENDLDARLAELFLDGKIEFSARTVPPLTLEWYFKGQLSSEMPVL